MEEENPFLARRDVSKAQRIGLMGGTFDPIHYGHLVTAEVARVKFQLEVVVFVPSGIPPHKQAIAISPGRDRFMMTVLATATNPHFEVSRAELDRKGPSYTIDTVREFQRRCAPGAEIFFITGADAALEIFTWKDARELLRACAFIVATRPGYCMERLEAELAEARRLAARGVFVVEVPALAISSTDIRARVAEGDPIRYLLPESVENYIRKAGLYRSEAGFARGAGLQG